MELWQYFLLTGVGLVAGIINVIAGGGSLLTLPVMILTGLPAPVANGTNRVAILAQNITAVSAFRKKGFSDFRRSITLALCTVPGGLAGAWCGAMVRGELFNRILAGVMIGVVILMATKSRKVAEKREAGPVADQKRRLVIGHICMFFIGFYGGFIQAGVGFLIMATLNKVMRLDLVEVNMHKVFIVGAFTLAALFVFVGTGNVLWLPGIALAIGNSAGGWIGSHLTISKGEVFVRRFLYIALIVMAVKLLF
ncbi:MAG: sulfite exporter TauE/SafE family protein [Verrucomicrobiales bacterium]|nr:sulfite exporter TauE/SafE family protein [Verrucomicrobiales bacterium]